MKELTFEEFVTKWESGDIPDQPATATSPTKGEVMYSRDETGEVVFAVIP